MTDLVPATVRELRKSAATPARRSRALAIVADVAVPLGIWIVAGASPALHGVQAWLTPFASVQNLLSGDMDAWNWAQVGVVVLVWVVALNAVGISRVHHLRGTVGR